MSGSLSLDIFMGIVNALLQECPEQGQVGLEREKERMGKRGNKKRAGRGSIQNLLLI